jgi:hypothetical protein
MLSMTTDVEVATGARAGSAEGAVLPLSAGIATGSAATASGRGVIAFVRPRAVWAAADVFGQDRYAVGQNPAAGCGQAACPSNPIEQNPHMTRIAAASGGGLGPHPARDPV